MCGLSTKKVELFIQPIIFSVGLRLPLIQTRVVTTPLELYRYRERYNQVSVNLVIPKSNL